MENPTPFDLNQALHEWRHSFSASPAFKASDLDELEAHLRDSVADLETKGLSPYEAFWVARNRLGTGEALNCEFGKANPQQVWLDRFLWMVIGSLGIGIALEWVSLLVDFAQLSMCLFTSQVRFIGPLALALYLGITIALLVLVWRSAQKRHGILWRTTLWMQAHPVATPAGILFLNLAASASRLGFHKLAYGIFTNADYFTLLYWRAPFHYLSMIAWPILLAVLLTRAARKAPAR